MNEHEYAYENAVNSRLSSWEAVAFAEESRIKSGDKPNLR